MTIYKNLLARHPDHDASYWRRCRAFYAGGKRLLNDRSILSEVFPRHLAELPAVYAERVNRAFYIPYAGEIINSIVAGLFEEEISVTADEEVDEFYKEFFSDCSPPAGRKCSLNELLKRQVLTALICRRAWTLVDLPEVGGLPAGESFASAAQEEEAGALNAYAVPIDPEMVLDWEENEDGELEWALIAHTSRRREGLEAGRDIIREEYTYYTANTWQRYSVAYPPGEQPSDKTDIPLTSEGVHTFGRVPLLRLELTDGMWAMGKILPIAIAHFNLRNALSWAEYKSLFPVLAAFKQGLDPMNPATDDPERERHQTYGQGYIAGFAEKDRLEYVSPDSGPFGAAMADLSNLRDEMHRVLHHMALSVDNSAAALQRSADSKQIDAAATAVILRALGMLVRDHVREIYELVQAGRIEEVTAWRVSGMDRFDETNVDSLMTQAETVDTVSIPSARFKQLWSFQLARRLLGDVASEEDLEEIRTELERNISNEQYEVPFTGNAYTPPPQEDEEDDEDDEDDEDEDELMMVEERAKAVTNQNNPPRSQRRQFQSRPKPE